MDFDENQEEAGDQGQEGNFGDDLLLIEDDTQAQYKSMKDCVIFLLDCNNSMLDNHAINRVLAVSESFLKTKIISNEKDIIGLILYNTETTQNNFNFSGINVKIPLAPPDAGLIKNIKTLQQMTNPELNLNYKQFLVENFPPSQMEISLASALTVCHSELKNYDEKSHNKRIFLFTDNDNPMNGNFTERNITIQRAKDMLESEIIIELFPMNFNSSFDMRKFYSDIIPMTVDSNEDLILSRENCEDRIRELTKRIRQKEIKKRTLGKCPLFLTKDVKFMVNFYSCIKKTNKSRSYNVDARTNKSLNTITQLICKETGGILYQNQIGTFQPYGNVKVPFTKDEMKQIKTMDTPGIKLMGFKSFDSIKPYYNIRESYFLYPDESLTTGSSQTCDALIKQMLNKNKVAIVKFIPREGANIRFCALVPQKECFDEDFFQTPPGFNLIFLPYADEIRSNTDIMKRVKNADEIKSAEEEITNVQMEAARRLIKKMNIEFDSRNFENPSLQKFYATLQALALGEQDIEKIEDYINPNDEALSRVLNNCDEEFKNIFWGYNIERSYVPGQKKPVQPKKRKEEGEVTSEQGAKKSTKKGKKNQDGMVVDEEEDGKKKKKSKKSDDQDGDPDSKPKRGKSSKKKNPEDGDVEMNDGEEITNDKLLNLLEGGFLESRTAKDLKNICKSKGISVKSRETKKDIINHIQEYLFTQLKSGQNGQDHVQNGQNNPISSIDEEI
jgi:ATP-dependent DNA helicase 2 subunit 1